jgi:tRNAThr (cytosine32-N3)-methyltransferase
MDPSNGEPQTANPSTVNAALIKDISSLTVRDSCTAIDAYSETPPHRSHDPQTNLKKTDPFQFGSRFLNQEDNVFEFNAWDHVETDDTYKEYAELQYAKQREAPVSEFDKSRYLSSLPLAVLPVLLHPDDSKIMHSSSEVY